MMEKKKYLIPECLIIDFEKHDIITDSESEEGDWWWGDAGQIDDTDIP